MINFCKLFASPKIAHLLVVVTAAGAIGCVSTDPWAAYQDLDPDGNIFVQGYGNQRPRYGHGGTESPSARRAREEQERRAAARAESEKRAAERRARDRREAEAEQARVERDTDRSGEINPVDSLADDKPELPSGIDEIAPTRNRDPEPLPDVEAKPEPPKPVPTQETLAYGRPVPGKPGMVYSPYSPDAGYVDVRGIVPGTKVKCPYTKKLFRVP